MLRLILRAVGVTLLLRPVPLADVAQGLELFKLLSTVGASWTGHVPFVRDAEQ